MNKYIFLPALFLLLTGIGISQGQDTETIPVTRFEAVDVLASVDFAARRVIIGGTTYPMAPGIKWYGLEPGVKPELQVHRINRKRVGYILAWDGRTPVVTAIWVFTE